MSVRPALRPYQAAAVTALVSAVRAGEHPVASLPTGAGKSVVVAGVVAELLPVGRILVVVPSRELAEQNEGALRRMLPAASIGVACAALGRRELDAQVIVGTPQSLAGAVGFDPAFVIVDEAHQMPLHKGSWFARLFAGLPRGRATPRVGLSATTFRTADGAIYGRPDSWFTCQPYEIGVPELVEAGFLAPVRYVAPAALMTVRGVARSAGDYNQAQLVRANLEQVIPQVRIVLDAMRERRKGLIFAVTVDHARAYLDELRKRGERPALIVGAIKAKDRDKAVRSFRNGRARMAVTVQAALTGFDVPDLDLIASCRPTMSPIIHTQSIGRGTRPAAGKADLLVLDFAANVPRFGPVHAPHFDRTGQPLGGVAPWRSCRACGTYSPFEAEACGHCGAPLVVAHAVDATQLEFGTIDWTRESRAVEIRTAVQGTERLAVESMALHAYRKASDPTSLSCMISYGLGGGAIVRTWFKRLDTSWWRRQWTMLLGDDPAPRTLREACARRGELVRPASIDLAKDGAFWRVVAVDYGDAADESAAA
ncbi:DEAD/DEAH box helicase [Hansschlegelia plantiphila]|uniref:DEAD/DEAH box helicase n=1 Tax=Hansschlegelia plantiphila TaxID=374655 RepID=A0A9W6MWF6_9HYPH|nr:DEAD/DEAH box helicase [Hansschlegelia plantiphila]GLK68966.1 hypothetical protein GCM10008179_26040 [Hansschlegelia plantiphila]